MIGMAQAMASGAMPSGHPSIAGSAATTGAATMPPAPADADLQKLLQFVKPVPPPVERPAK